MDAWSIGVEKALATISTGVETGNGSLIQIGLDRLRTRAEMSEELGAAFPNAFAEAVQEGMTKAWRRNLELAEKQGQQAFWPSVLEDSSWLLGIISKQDDWSNLCVEEAVRLMASSAARCRPLVSALKTMKLTDCLPAASSFFAALSTYDRMTRIAKVDEDVQNAIGGMLLAWNVDQRDPGPWKACPELASLFSDQESWPVSAGIRAASITMALKASEAENASVAPERARKSPRG